MQVKVSLPDSLVQHIDELRGDVSRSLFIRRRLEERLGHGVGDKDHATAFIGGSPEPIREPPTPKADRSPEPVEKADAEMEHLIDKAGEKMPRLSKPPLQRPIVQKRQ